MVARIVPPPSDDVSHPEAAAVRGEDEGALVGLLPPEAPPAPGARSVPAARISSYPSGNLPGLAAATSAGAGRVLVQGVAIDAVDWEQAVERIEGWAAQRQSAYVAICNSHSVVTAAEDPEFADALAMADMATADGMPVAWMMRRLGHPGQQRINGPDLMLRYCATAARTGTSIYLYGSTDAVLDRLVERLEREFPGLRIAGRCSPPFRPLTEGEEAQICRSIADAHAGVVFVSLGCPKQEKWMRAHRGRIPAVMIGVGAAFDYHAGTLSRAPQWMRDRGLEWLHRLALEPRRLWKRYLVTNTLFSVRALGQLLRRK